MRGLEELVRVANISKLANSCGSTSVETCIEANLS